MKKGTPWSRDELTTALEMYEAGSNYDEIGEAIGRTHGGVYDMLRKRFGVCRARPEYFDGPPIGVTMECERNKKDAKLGSMILREACMDMFCRTANKYHISLDDAMACHLGYHAQPKREAGSERPYVSQRAFGMAA